MTSQPIPILRGRADKGKIAWNPGDGTRFRMVLGKLEGAEIEVTVRKRRKTRSIPQNSYYWSVVVGMLAEAAGYLPEEMHDALRFEFLRSHGDSALPTVRSTTDLSTIEFEEYMRKCRMLGSQMYGLYIPTPNEADY